MSVVEKRAQSAACNVLTRDCDAGLPLTKKYLKSLSDYLRHFKAAVSAGEAAGAQSIVKMLGSLLKSGALYPSPFHC